MSLIDVNSEKTSFATYPLYFVLGLICHYLSGTVRVIAYFDAWKQKSAIGLGALVVIVLIAYASSIGVELKLHRSPIHLMQVIIFVFMIILMHFAAIQPFEFVNTALTFVLKYVDAFVAQVLISMVGGFAVFRVVEKLELRAQNIMHT